MTGLWPRPMRRSTVVLSRSTPAPWPRPMRRPTVAPSRSTPARLSSPMRRLTIAPVAGDAPVGPPDAPIDNRTFAGDTGQLSRPIAPADNRSVAVDTGPVGLADGGAETSGPQPRVLVIDPATDQFLTYDRDGLPCTTITALSIRRGYDRRSVWAESLFVAWDTATATDLTYNTALTSAPLGLG